MTTNVTMKPKISVNELGKYLDTSDDLKRQGILKKQKEQNPGIASYWNDAEKTITKFLANGMDDEEVLVSAIDRLHATPSQSRNGRVRKNHNINAIECFRDMHTRIPVVDMVYQKASVKGWKIDIAGVDINIRPEILLVGNKAQGGIKLFFGGRTSTLATDSMETIAALLHHGIGRNGEKAKQSACILIDVFNQSWHAAPNTYKMKMRRLEATCATIKLRWDAI